MRHFFTAMLCFLVLTQLHAQQDMSLTAQESLSFRSVRIPCAWVLGHISDADNYTIDAT